EDHEAVVCRGMLHRDLSRKIVFPNGKGPDVIHAWTARERVRRVAEQTLNNHPQAVLIVHLEDNEKSVLRAATPRPVKDLLALTKTEFDRTVSPDVWHP